MSLISRVKAFFCHQHNWEFIGQVTGKETVVSHNGHNFFKAVPVAWFYKCKCKRFKIKCGGESWLDIEGKLSEKRYNYYNKRLVSYLEKFLPQSEFGKENLNDNE